MTYKLSNYVKILKRKDKVVLCNGETGFWIRMSNQVFQIIKTILDENLDINELENNFEDSDDYKFIKSTYSQLIEERYILSEDTKFQNIIVSLEMTHRCNLHCIHCCIDAQNNLSEKEDLSTEQVLEIFNKFIQWNPIAIMLSGGEPMIRKDFYELLKYLRKNYKGKIILATNGTFINDKNVSKLCESCDQIDISLDGVDEETTSLIRGKGVFDKVIKAINLIKATGFDKVTLSIVISDKSAHLEEKFKLLAKRLGVKPIIRLFSPVGRGEKYEHVISNIKENEYYINKEYLNSDSNEGVTCSTCTAGTRELFVNYKGDIYPCPSFIREDCRLENIFNISSLQECVSENSIGYKCEKVNKLDQRKKDKCKDCCVNEFCWTCPGNALSLKNKEKIDYICKLVKPMLIRKVWGE